VVSKSLVGLAGIAWLMRHSQAKTWTARRRTVREVAA
jgi:hypothetical protein